jgi:hypothetical protein
LYKTEKTHFGTLVEINLQREFGFADGRQWISPSAALTWTASTRRTAPSG